LDGKDKKDFRVNAAWLGFEARLSILNDNYPDCSHNQHPNAKKPPEPEINLEWAS
jgi:hypothetical protein